MFDLSELDRWDAALAALTPNTPAQTPVRVDGLVPHAAPAVGPLQTGGKCPFGYGRTTHDG